VRNSQNAVLSPSAVELECAPGRYAQQDATQVAGQNRGKACHGFRVAHALLLLTLALLSVACAPEVTRHNSAGNELFATGAYDEALSAYRQAQVNDPDVAEPYYNAANALNRQGNLEGAQAQSGQALKTADPDLAAPTWYNLGNGFFDAEDWEQAIAAYQAALRIDPDDMDAKRNLELALQQQNDEQQQQNQDSQQGEQDQQPETSPDSATPTPSGTDQDETSQQAEQPAQETQDQNQGTDSLSPEQAQQLFEALVGDGETLQERLQKTFQVPGLPPERDW